MQMSNKINDLLSSALNQLPLFIIKNDQLLLDLKSQERVMFIDIGNSKESYYDPNKGVSYR